MKINQQQSQLKKEDMVPMKGRFPFRIGTTSYILPDDLVPNVVFLSSLIDDVELVLFESEDISNLPDEQVIRRLATLKQEENISYTVHLPLDIHLGSFNEEIRQRSVEKCIRVIHLTSPLSPFAFIVHFHGDMRGKEPAMDMHRWKQSLDRSVRDILSSGVSPDLLSVETLDYPFENITDIISSHDLSICLDVGHLAFYGYPIQQTLENYIHRTRVVHLHGNSQGKDHQNISMLDPVIVEMLVTRLADEKQKERVLTMEIFGYDAFKTSMETIRRYV